jgi:hypothetical protein
MVFAEVRQEEGELDFSRRAAPAEKVHEAEDEPVVDSEEGPSVYGGSFRGGEFRHCNDVEIWVCIL